MHRLATVAIATLICALVGSLSCAGAPSQPEEARCEECIQPPLRRAELLVHLAAEQAAIAQRMKYTGEDPRPITEIAHGPTPEHPWRDPQTLSTTDLTYEGRLGWHRVAVDPVETAGIEQRALRGKDTHAAHCFFAARPNARSPIFALFATHDARRGDTLHVGREGIELAKVELALDHERAPIRVLRTEQLCAFRPDQNLSGAMIVTYTRQDLSPPHNGPFYGVVLVTLSDVRSPTGEYATVEMEGAGGRFGQEAELREVQVERFEAPNARLIGPFVNVVEAMNAAEEHIPRGRFRLRPEHTFVRMPKLSYLGAQADEFCPVRANCEVEDPPVASSEGDASTEDADDASSEGSAEPASTSADESDTAEKTGEDDETPKTKSSPAPRVAPDTRAPSADFPTRR